MPASPGPDRRPVTFRRRPACMRPAIGKEVSPGSYAIIEREWRRGDQVELTLPMPIRVHGRATATGGDRADRWSTPTSSRLRTIPPGFTGARASTPTTWRPSSTPPIQPWALPRSRLPKAGSAPRSRSRARQKPRAPMFAHAGGKRSLPGEKNVDDPPLALCQPRGADRPPRRLSRLPAAALNVGREVPGPCLSQTPTG